MIQDAQKQCTSRGPNMSVLTIDVKEEFAQELAVLFPEGRNKLKRGVEKFYPNQYQIRQCQILPSPRSEQAQARS